ncbi:hypothetical protein B0H34DRAFT_673387 [Crassisporium funariophilum]|nr:hypothetical protein B0H34DRAFT_673387 [Crassisporium funariophilum]
MTLTSDSSPGLMRTNHVQGLMWISILLSILVLGTDGSGVFAYSLFSSPAPSVLSITHHITILTLVHKQSRRSLDTTAQPVMTKVGTIVCAWLLALLWLAIICLFITTMSWVGRENEFERIKVVHGIALAASILEFGVMITIALKCTWDRDDFKPKKRITTVTGGKRTAAASIVRDVEALGSEINR